MTLEETFHPQTDKGSLAYVALGAIEAHLKEHGFKLGLRLRGRHPRSPLGRFWANVEVDPA